jgi:hypothetical protein
MITASYVEGIYTYELNDPVYVLFYIEDASGIHYDVVKARNLLDIATKAKDNTSFSATERAVYTRMVELHNAITAHRETFTSIPEMAEFAAPKVTVGMFGSYQTGYTVNHSTNIILIEPWGIRLNGYVDKNEKLEDSGVVVFNDKDGQYETAPSVEELINNPAAYVLSTKDGNATAAVSGSYTKITADFNKDIYTYQLNDNMYAVFFVKIDGVYHFGEVKTRNVLTTIADLVNNEKISETERAVYQAMINMHEDVVTHRAKFE